MSQRRRVDWRKTTKMEKSCVLALAVVGMAQGQQDSASVSDIQCNSTTKWMDNSANESPCRVARNLITNCAPPSDPVSIPPLDENTTFYANNFVWSNPACSCNIVVYNLISGCEVCQGHHPIALADWTSSCPPDSVQDAYPDVAIAADFHTPSWASVNTTAEGTFNLKEAKEVAAGKTSAHWNTIQILAPIIAAIGVFLISLGIFLWYRRRVKKRYVRVGDQNFFNNTRANASSSTMTLRSWIAGASTDRSASTRRTKYKGKSVAWQAANLQAPRKLGGLFPNRPRVHQRTRGADWSIDTDEMEFDDLDPLQPGSSTSNMNGNGSTPSFASSHGRSHRMQGSGRNADDEGLRPIQDAPDVVGLTNVRPTQGVDRRGRPPPVHVVSTPPQRGFHLDDVDSAGTPTPVATRPPDEGAPPRNAGQRAPGSGVVLISRTPGEDFSSTVVTSPVETEGMRSFPTSRQDSGAQWAPAFTDDSSILRPSFSRDRFALRPATTDLAARHSPPPEGNFPPSSFHIPRPRPSDPQLLIPQSVRAAGYSPELGIPHSPNSHSYSASDPNLPMTRDVDIDARTRHTTMLSEVASSRSSDYNVPNPWRLDPRKPYSASHLSPPLPPAVHTFKSSLPVDFDLDA